MDMIDFILRLCRRPNPPAQPIARKRPPSRLRVRAPIDLIDLTAQDETTQARVREAIQLPRPWLVLWTPGGKRRPMGEA
jgi:hypothetical protein